MARSNHDDFDGYRKWLGITNKKRLPTHYELLGISLDEDDPEVIQAAAEQRRHFVESKRGDGHDAIVTEILYRISEAENTLLNNEMRRDYDRQRKLWEKRQKNRQIDPIASRSRVRSRPEPTVGEGTGFVSTFAGILGVFCVAIAIMTWFSFQLPWFESADQVEAAPIVQVPAPVAAPAQVAPVAVKPDLAKPQATEPVKTVVKLDKPLAIANVDRAAVTVPPSAEVERATIADEITNSIGMKLKLIRAGEFLMGSPDNETGRDSDETQHRVQLTTSYYLGVTEVTQGQWFAMMQTKPWSGKKFVKEGEDYPATFVSWDDAVEYSVKLSAAEGKTYRLPTEAEWEYACRGGKSTAYSFGNDSSQLSSYSWWGGSRGDGNAQAEQYALKVGGKQSNPFGLHDMHGNVWEWCSDWEADYDSSFAVDPSGPLTGSGRVGRGGGWGDGAALCRAANRRRYDPTIRVISMGFRLALSPSVKSDSQRPKLKGNLTVEALDFEIVSPGQRATIADEITNSIGMKLKLIPAGEFLMGSPDNETGRDSDETQHRVQLTTSYYLGVTEVTQGQWFAMMQTKPWSERAFVKEGEDYPATNVSWDDAVEYSVKLSAAEGKTYRLPTEAEWEYACRGGKSTAYSFGSDATRLKDYAWLNANASAIGERYAHEVGTKQSNPFGLHDMHGNVWEWCSDWDADYDSSFAVDPSGPLTGSGRVARGGNWGNEAAGCRAAYRRGSDPTIRDSNVGFRLALSPSVK